LYREHKEVPYREFLGKIYRPYIDKIAVALGKEQHMHY
jgi:hypothetical protein